MVAGEASGAPSQRPTRNAQGQCPVPSCGRTLTYEASTRRLICHGGGHGVVGRAAEAYHVRVGASYIGPGNAVVHAKADAARFPFPVAVRVARDSGPARLEAIEGAP